MEIERYLLLRGLYACLPDQAHEIGDRISAKLLHDAAAMYFDGLFGDTELCGNLFVQHTGDDATKNLIFARSEQFDSSLDFQFFLITDPRWQ
jgi:hypothetical protein